MPKPNQSGRRCEDGKSPMRTILHINVPDTLRDTLRAKSIKRGVSMARLCRVLLERGVR